MIKLVIPGKPMGKQRPRVCKNGIAFTPKETVNYETLIKQLYIEKYPNEKLLDSELKIEIIAYYEIPKSKPKKIKCQMISNEVRPTVKPDIDNICKIICDALNSIAYSDDKQIVECIVKKYYAEKPQVEILLSEIRR